MNPKKPKSRKSKSAGISLEPDLIKRAKDFAKKNGFGSLSNLVRFLLTQELSRAKGDPTYKLEESMGNAEPVVGATIQPTSETFGSGPSTRTKKNSRKTG